MTAPTPPPAAPRPFGGEGASRPDGGQSVPRLIGGEMLGWSDARQGGRPPARGPLLAHLVGALPAVGRTLVAGPHDPALVAAVAGGSVTCLLRSVPDAGDLAGLGVDVRCGTLSKVDAGDRYDTVIAVDGLDRLCSVEGPQLDWLESLRALRAVLQPGGTLLLAVENAMGVHRLVEPSAATTAHTDADWVPAGAFDTGRPGTPTRLVALLAAEGLAVSWLAAGWPSPHAPTLLATPDALAGPGGQTGAMQAAASAAIAAAYGGRAVLTDPRRLAADAVRAGLGAELAPAWVLVAHRSPGPRTAAGRAPDIRLPPVLLSDPVLGLSVSGPVLAADRDHDGRWVRRIVSPPGPGSHPEPMPVGRLLEEQLLAACLGHDLATIRRLLSRYVIWLRSLADGRAAATVDNVLVDHDGAFAMAWPVRPGTPGEPPADVAAVRALRRFATTLVRGGHAHPWATAPDVDTLTVLVCAAAAMPVDAQLHAAAIELEVEVRSALRPDVDRTILLEEVRRPGPATPVIDPRGWREREDHTRQLDARLSEARARVGWCEAELARREAELRRARLQIAVFSGRPLYRVTRSAAAGARRLLRRFRRAVRR